MFETQTIKTYLVNFESRKAGNSALASCLMTRPNVTKNLFISVASERERAEVPVSFAHSEPAKSTKYNVLVLPDFWITFIQKTERERDECSFAFVQPTRRLTFPFEKTSIISSRLSTLNFMRFGKEQVTICIFNSLVGSMASKSKKASLFGSSKL